MGELTSDDVKRPNPYPNIPAKSNYTPPNWRSLFLSSTQSSSRRASISTAFTSRSPPSATRKDESELPAQQSPTLVETPDEEEQDQALRFHSDING